MELINYQEAAKLLGVEIGTLYAWVCKKRLPCFRLGPRAVRFSKEELEAWLETHREGPSNLPGLRNKTESHVKATR